MTRFVEAVCNWMFRGRMTRVEFDGNGRRSISSGVRVGVRVTDDRVRRLLTEHEMRTPLGHAPASLPRQPLLQRRRNIARVTGTDVQDGAGVVAGLQQPRYYARIEPPHH